MLTEDFLLELEEPETLLTARPTLLNFQDGHGFTKHFFLEEEKIDLFLLGIEATEDIC